MVDCIKSLLYITAIELLVLGFWGVAKESGLVEKVRYTISEVDPLRRLNDQLDHASESLRNYRLR